MELAPGTTIDRYTVEVLLGTGGMGSVYRVRHTELGSTHALKLLHSSRPGLTERLLQEGRLQSGLQHPGVLRVTDLVQHQGHPALVLEFVEGRSLADHLDGRPFDADRLDVLVRRLLEGVAAAHRHGLIHRDLKPENVLMAEVDGQLQPKVADFGLARALHANGPRLTASNTPMGTPAYMAPEQFRDASRVDARADVFSLGAILYELVTGRMAFSGSLPEVLGKAGWGDYAPVLELVPDAPQAWVDAIDGALRPDPDDRIADVSDLLATWAGAPRPSPDRVHPSLEDLLQRRDTHSAHLADCAACRVELRLYEQAFQGDTLHPEDFSAEPGPSPWPARALGAGLGLLGTCVVLAAVLGGLSKLTRLGFWWPIYLAVGAAGGAALVTGRQRLAEGQPPGLLRWVWAPTLLVTIGQAACAMGALVALDAIAAAPVDLAPVLVAAASAVTLSAWAAAQALAVPLLLVALALVVLARRRGPGAHSWETWPAALAVTGGGLMWLAESLVAAERTATLWVYGAVVVAGMLGSLLPDEAPEDGPARLLGATAVLLTGWSAALGVQVADLQALQQQTAATSWTVPAEAVQAARDFALAWSAALNPWTLAWMALSAGVAVLVMAQTHPVHRAGLLRPALRLTLLLTLVPLPATAWNATVLTGLTEQVVPAWQAAAVARWVPSLHLRTEGDAVVAGPGSAGPFQAGDRVVAVGDRTVDSLAGLVALLQDCPDCTTVSVERAGRLLAVEAVRSAD